MRIRNDNMESFTDGHMDICEVKDRVIVRTKHEKIRFGEKTVGVTRFWQAKLASNTVDRLVAVPNLCGLNRMDVCLIGAEQYEIKQIQQKLDSKPPCFYLSLQRLALRYKDQR